MHDMVTSQAPALSEPKGGGLHFGMAARVLAFIIGFVMLTEVAVYAPSIANYRDNWLRNRLSAGFTAALVLEAAPRDMIPDTLAQQLLDGVGARIIVLKMHDTRRILAASKMPPKVDETYDLRQSSWVQMLASAYRTLTAPPGRVLTILGEAPMGGDAVEITLDESNLQAAMLKFSHRIILAALIVSAIAAAIAALTLHFMVLRPVRRLTTSLVAFGADPENESHIIEPSGARHEVGRAEEALAIMQSALLRELQQKKRLAALGLAVAKINHDMRNMLSVAQLLTDRLTKVTDPLALRVAPKLVATLDRAIRFCEATLAYGRAVDEPPSLAPLALRPLVEDAAEAASLAGPGTVAIDNRVPRDFEIVGDGEQLYRVVNNLVRNGVEALQRAGAGGETPRIVIAAWHEARTTVIEVSDNGPGVPAAVRGSLFAAFTKSSRVGGSGLGLAIAADLVRAHGGTIALKPEEERGGARFRVTLPARAAAVTRLSA